VLTLIGWSSIPLFLRHFKDLIDPWTANGWRYGFSALMWAPVLLVGVWRKNLPPGLWKAALWPSVFNIAGQICFAQAPYFIEPGLMTFSLRAQIVFVTLGAALMFPAERLVIRRPGYLLGMPCVVGGTVATILLKPDGLGKGTATGVILALASGIFYSGYSLCVRRFMHGTNPLQAFAAISQYTAVGVLIPMFIWGKRFGMDAIDLQQRQFLYLLLSSLIGIGIGHTLYYFSIGRLGLAVSSGVVQLQPFIVSVASMFIFKEHLSAMQWGTGAIAILGAIVILVEQHRVAARQRELEQLEPTPKRLPHECPSCGYDLRGLESQVCPECGLQRA